MSLQVFKYNTALEKQKIFISGLPFSCTKEQLEQLCGSHGAITDVRLVTYRSGKPKVSSGEHWPPLVPPPDPVLDSVPPAALQGLAYVEFSSEAEASQAVLKMDGTEVEGNKISVAISNPPRRTTTTDRPAPSRTSADLLSRQLYGA